MSAVPAPRLRSLDVFRGATVMLMIVVNNPGSWQHLYPPLAHAAWHGWTLTDLVFPFFLFAVGNALALTEGRGGPFWAHWVRRSVLIFGLGLMLNAAPFVRWTAEGTLAWRDLETLRWMGVLQRIALAWAVAALIVRAGGVRAALAASAALLLGYWGACVALATGSDPYSLEGFFGTALDRAVLGAAHLYRGEGVPFDPEGLASTVPAIAQVLLGYVAGRAIAGGPGVAAAGGGAAVPRVGPLALVLAAFGLLALAALWQLAVPVNKKIWTPPYVLLSTGLAVALMAALVVVVDRRGLGGPLVRIAEAHGRNALFIFVLSGFVPRLLGLLKGPPPVAGAGGAPAAGAAGGARATLESLLVDPRAASLAVALLHLAAYTAIAVWMDRRRLYVRV